ncbi:MAG: 4Fe-4S dicluster domain-containing protein, partial [Ruminococcaceae bacterium]|nr:4Fe-4S dicluster domain-containing protein [Oscillospiraceae bacterium]
DIEESTVETFEKYDAWSIVLKKKAEGKIKKLGFSFHGSPELLERLLTERGDNVDFVQLQINYADWEDPKIRSKSCYEIARRFGKDIIVMEPVKGGSLATLPEKAAKIFKEIRPDKSIASWAMRFVASLDGVIMVLSGMNSFEQLNDNISVFEDPEPFSDVELDGIRKVNEIILASLAVKCTGCAYCVDACPSSIDIPKLFSLYNGIYSGEKKEEILNEYAALESKASSCVECGACAEKCPQHIRIPKKMKEIAKELGN